MLTMHSSGGTELSGSVVVGYTILIEWQLSNYASPCIILWSNSLDRRDSMLNESAKKEGTPSRPVHTREQPPVSAPQATYTEKEFVLPVDT